MGRFSDFHWTKEHDDVILTLGFVRDRIDLRYAHLTIGAREKRNDRYELDRRAIAKQKHEF